MTGKKLTRNMDQVYEDTPTAVAVTDEERAHAQRTDSAPSQQTHDADGIGIICAKPKRPARERKKLARFELLHSMTVEERRQYLLAEEAQKLERQRMLEQTLSATDGVQRLAIDLSFDAIMNDKELRSLAKQMKLSYGFVKQMATPFQLHFLNCSEPLQQLLARFSADKWRVHWHHDAHITDIAASSVSSLDVVYLSPDSPNVLTALDATKMYVIGGIVDKSRKKGATLNAATSAGVTTARLPIQEYITERLDHILNVNTVVDVLISFQKTGDWAYALTHTLPQPLRHDDVDVVAEAEAEDGDEQQQREQLNSDDIDTVVMESDAEEIGSGGGKGVHGEGELELPLVRLEGPLTYTAPEHFRAFPAPHTTNRHGSFGLHHDKHCDPRAISKGATTAAGRDSITLKRESPSPWQYAPTSEGQFPRACTAGDIQKVSDACASTVPIARRKQKGSGDGRRRHSVALQTLKVALGPGSYEIDKDIATSFSFGKETRKGILEFTTARSEHGCSVGPGGYRSETATIRTPSTGAMAQTVAIKTKHVLGFVSRVRSESELQRPSSKIASIPKELAKSYAQLDASTQKLDRRMVSPSTREASFQRFDKVPATLSQPPRNLKGENVDVPASVQVCFDALEPHAGGVQCDESLAQNDKGGKYLNCEAHLTRKLHSNFGCVQHRELRKFMIAAGHASADIVGPGVYETADECWKTQTHNLLYKVHQQRHVATSSKGTKASTRKFSSNQSARQEVSIKDGHEDMDACSRDEMWRKMKHGPTPIQTTPGMNK
ncbi:tRNA methyltransferase, partial [Globisporangium splendens]